jgi:ketosteroid isomerase-like protein
MTMTAREAFERGTDTFNAHDIDGFAAVLADDVVFAAPGGIRGKGKAACAEFFAGWFQAFSDARLNVHNVHFIDDLAVEEGTFSGTHDGPLHSPTGDIPPTGCPVSVPYIHVLHFHEGNHTSFNLMFDRLAMLEQLGLTPTLSPAG